MLDLTELKDQRKHYSCSCRNVGEDKIVRLFDNNDDLIGVLKMSDLDDSGYYEVMESDCKVKGAGKMLYYYAMHFISPSFLAPDLCGFSNDANRVWQALYSAEFVEKKPIECITIGEEIKGFNYGAFMCRFTWKQ